MRIITGDYRGRRLESPADRSVRPTTDKVKEAMFNILMYDVEDAVICDLFAGTGNLGLEALSRGAVRCYFGDKSRDSINLVRKNVAICGAESKSVILAGDFQRVLSAIKEKVDVFLLDPPYKAGLMIPCIEKISSLELLSDEGVIVAEHGKDEVLPETIGSYTLQKERVYGSIVLSIYGL